MLIGLLVALYYIFNNGILPSYYKYMKIEDNLKTKCYVTNIGDNNGTVVDIDFKFNITDKNYITLTEIIDCNVYYHNNSTKLCFLCYNVLLEVGSNITCWFDHKEERVHLSSRYHEENDAMNNVSFLCIVLVLPIIIIIYMVQKELRKKLKEYVEFKREQVDQIISKETYV